MHFVEECVLFLAACFVGIWAFSNVVLPVIYSFPRCMVWALRGWLKWRAVFLCFIPPLLWSGALLVAYCLLKKIHPAAWAPDEYWSCVEGMLLGVGGTIIYALFSQGGRDTMAEECFMWSKQYLTTTGVAQRSCKSRAEPPTLKRWHNKLVAFKMPDMGEGVAEGQIVTWLVKPGDAVKEDQPFVEVMTNKATVQLPSPIAGTVKELRAQAGQAVKVGAVIAVFEVGQ